MGGNVFNKKHFEEFLSKAIKTDLKAVGNLTRQMFDIKVCSLYISNMTTNFVEDCGNPALMPVTSVHLRPLV